MRFLRYLIAGVFLVIPLTLSAGTRKDSKDKRHDRPPVTCTQMRFEGLGKQLITCSDGTSYYLDLDATPPIPANRPPLPMPIPDHRGGLVDPRSPTLVTTRIDR